jgi:hypothetical protein
MFVFYCCFIRLKPTLNERYAFLPDKQELEIHVITNYPVMTEKPWNENQTERNKTRLWQRQEEVEETLQRNLNHPLVTAVHLLVNQPLAEQRLHELNLHNKQKVFLHRVKALPTYRDFFDYANDRLKNQIVIVMNMDIYIGEGFEKLNKTFLVKRNVSYALTRSGRLEQRCNMAGKRGYCETGYIGSHDVYIFVLTQRLKESILSELDYEMHLYGGDNRLLWVLKNQMKKKLLNPCKYLRTYHNHCVDIHSSIRPRINENGKSGWVPPSGLYE